MTVTIPKICLNKYPYLDEISTIFRITSTKSNSLIYFFHTFNINLVFDTSFVRKQLITLNNFQYTLFYILWNPNQLMEKRHKTCANKIS